MQCTFCSPPPKDNSSVAKQVLRIEDLKGLSSRGAVGTVDGPSSYLPVTSDLAFFMCIHRPTFRGPVASK